MRASAGWPSGDAVDGRRPTLLDDLLTFPRVIELVDGLRPGVGGVEHVRVAADQFVDQVACDLLDAEGVRVAFLRQPGVEEHLQQQVAEFLAQQRGVVALDRLDDLEAFLDQVAGERLVRLRGVPRDNRPASGAGP